MADDFKRDVEAVLRAHGCEWVREGRHPMWFSPITNTTFPVPHSIKSRHTANEILKQAGIGKRF